MERPRSVLFVCLGNICRSPMAEGAFRAALGDPADASRWMVDSAATADWNRGKRPDHRAVDVMSRNGIDISRQHARQVVAADFYDFELILGMDYENVAAVKRMRPPDGSATVALFLEHALDRNIPVPDPYFGDERDFDLAFDLISDAAAKLYGKLSIL